MGIETKRTFCRFCHANCAMLVEVEHDQILSVRGDADDPVFGGYTCIKGRQLAEAHNSVERFRSCKVKDGDGFRDIASETALDEIALKLRTIIDKHGPDAVAIYCGTYAFQNSAGVSAGMAFAQGLGSKHFYTSVTLDQPAKVYTSMRYGSWMGGLQSFNTADVALFIGNNPIVSHYGPPGGLPPFSPSRRLRDAIDGGLKLIVADPRVTDVAKLATIHLPVRPGEDPALLAGMLNVIISEGLYDHNFVGAYVEGFDDLKAAIQAFPPDVAAQRSGVEATDLVKAARLFATGLRGVASTGTGPEMAGRGTLTEYLVQCLNIICGRFCHEGEASSIPRVFTPATPRRAQVSAPVTPWGAGFPESRFRGLTHLGMEMPCNVMADEILTPGPGQIRALISFGGNPVVAFPDQEKIAAAIDDLELLVQIDVTMSATAKRADYILAPAMCLERDDITNLSEWWYEVPYARYTRALVKAPGDVMDEYAMLWGLAQRLGIALPLAGGACPMDVMPDKTSFLDLMTGNSPVKPSRVKADTPDGRAHIYDDLQPLVEPADGEAGRFILTAGDMPNALNSYAIEGARDADWPYRLVSRRTRHRFNSTGGHLPALKAKRTTNPAHIHPDDLAMLGMSEGDVIRIESEVGHVFAVVEASPELRRGVISMAHAWGEPDVGIEGVRTIGGGTNRLVSETVRFDPITGQSLQSAIPVRIMVPS
jgi:anaerobic selenocysteine-containing dehydrogenase